MSTFKSVTLRVNGGKLVRTETLHGKNYLVVPAVLITEGVRNNCLYRAQDLRHRPEGWGGRPLVMLHPEENGKPVSAGQPKIMEQRQVGFVFNPFYDEWKTGGGAQRKGLKSELWFDEARLKKVHPDTLQKINSATPFNISTGVFTDDIEAKGVFNGQGYDCTGVNHIPDHVAVLTNQPPADPDSGAMKTNAADSEEMGEVEYTASTLHTNDVSADDMRQMMRKALTEAGVGLPEGGQQGMTRAYIRDWFPQESYFVYDLDGYSYMQKFKQDGKTVTLDGGPQEAELQVQWCPKCTSAGKPKNNADATATPPPTEPTLAEKLKTLALAVELPSPFAALKMNGEG